jgi:hypothetical protein
VIGHHDSGRTDVQSTLCVPDTHDAFEAELFAPFLSDTRDSTPIGEGGEHIVGVGRVSQPAKNRATTRPTPWISDLL